MCVCVCVLLAFARFSPAPVGLSHARGCGAPRIPRVLLFSLSNNTAAHAPMFTRTCAVTVTCVSPFNLRHPLHFTSPTSRRGKLVPGTRFKRHGMLPRYFCFCCCPCFLTHEPIAKLLPCIRSSFVQLGARQGRAQRSWQTTVMRWNFSERNLHRKQSKLFKAPSKSTCIFPTLCLIPFVNGAIFAIPVANFFIFPFPAQ